MLIAVRICSPRWTSLANLCLALVALACSVTKGNDESAFGTHAGASSDDSGGDDSTGAGASTSKGGAGNASGAQMGGASQGGLAGQAGLAGSVSSGGVVSNGGAANSGGTSDGGKASGGTSGGTTSSGGTNGGASSTAGSSGASFDPNSGLVLYYDFDETSGTVAHDHVSPANDGVVRGKAAWTGAGQIRGALKLAGGQGDTADPQYVEIPPGVLRSLKEVTISTWIHWEGGWAWQRVFDFGADGDHCFFYTPDSGGAGQAVVRTMPGSNNVNLFITERPPLGKWMHLAVTWSSASFGLYMDGELMAFAPSGQSVPVPSVTPISLGISPRNFIGKSQTEADAYLEGSIDEFRIYDRVLSPAEIAALRAFRP